MSEERIAAIRERVEARPPLGTSHAMAVEVLWLLTEHQRLRAVADAARGMPEPMSFDGYVNRYCAYCDKSEGSNSPHDDDCTWLVLTQAALRALSSPTESGELPHGERVMDGGVE